MVNAGSSAGATAPTSSNVVNAASGAGTNNPYLQEAFFNICANVYVYQPNGQLLARVRPTRTACTHGQ
jgi:hypothetical protein